ncbi:uncharacterized protein FIBRA_00428 [Fibroporia radiculosa]|uniref:Uncharacterized protein n=1 Tax=Fibroporia radiculosa TaxID=599839 RepID=J4I7X7_9APHY|nr:uncharacterized protein FIBRA_00428 [Fibroporia radiculosa]CCL98431.1 predicted protein [Fibroporia radiculosa]
MLPMISKSLSSMHIEMEDPISAKYFPTDLTPAVSLRVLSLTVGFATLVEATKILSRTSLLELIEVRITLALSPTEDELDRMDKDCYPPIDQALSSRQYPALQKIAFDLIYYVRRSEVMDVISEGSWRSQLSSRFPALHAREQLVSSVSVNVVDEWE